MTPAQLTQLFQGIQATGILRAAVELDLFAAMARVGKATAATIAQETKTPARSTRILLEGLAALGLAQSSPEGFHLTEVAENHLVPASPAYMGDLVRIFGNDVMFDVFRGLRRAVENDGAVLPETAETPNHPFWNDFAAYTGAMAAPGGEALAGTLASWIETRSALRVLDIACGTGLYGYQIAMASPNAHITSQDWPSVLDQSRAYAERMNIADRVSWLPGDMFELDWGGPYDLVIMSHVFHHFADDRSTLLLDKAQRALTVDGRIAVHDFVRGIEAPASDPAPHLFATMMLGWTRHGEAYDIERFRRLLATAGFATPEVHRAAPMPTRFLIADRA